MRQVGAFEQHDQLAMRGVREEVDRGGAAEDEGRAREGRRGGAAKADCVLHEGGRVAAHEDEPAQAGGCC